MNNQRRVTILGVALAGVISVSMAEAPFSTWDTIIGIILTLLLILYARPDATYLKDRIAFASVLAFSLVITFGIVIDVLVPDQKFDVGNTSLRDRDLWYFAVWFTIFVLLFLFLKHLSLTEKQPT